MRACVGGKKYNIAIVADNGATTASSRAVFRLVFFHFPKCHLLDFFPDKPFLHLWKPKGLLLVKTVKTINETQTFKAERPFSFWRFSSGLNRKFLFHLHSNRYYRNVLVNGQRPLCLLPTPESWLLFFVGCNVGPKVVTITQYWRDASTKSLRIKHWVFFSH